MALAGIVAGGKGSRMGQTELPKQFMSLGGEPVIIHTIRAFLQCKEISNIIIGINPDWLDYMQNLKETYFSDKKNIFVTGGGADRNDTILNIIDFAETNFKLKQNEILVTHDAVRPFVTPEMISQSIFELQNYDICTAAIPATDTVVLSENEKEVSGFPLRKNVFSEQTPQTFQIKYFKDLYLNMNLEERENITDACKLFYQNHMKVGLINGSPMNLKLTYPHDFLLAEAYLKTQK